MPELRKDPIIGRWIIISTERGKRPTDFIVETNETRGGFCPLCPGNENTTPPEVLSYSSTAGHQANRPGWDLRVVPNKYPALIIEGNLNKEGDGLYDRMNGIGAHEVIIETPDHNESFANLPADRMIKVFLAYRDRLLDLAQDPRFRYVMVFKNFGAAAGASLEHSHSQLIALPIVPRMISSEIEGSLSYFKYKERCIFCDIIRQEINQDKRVVAENDLFLAIVPYAPRSPFEMWILPKQHASSYLAMDDAHFKALTAIFSECMRRLDTCIPNVPYNFVLHGAPLRSQPLEHYHWHFEIMPKLTMIAGFEWGSGFYINSIPPEEAAQFLKEAAI
ncbi:MAG: galactose-1-phosphate uridylyltransferase [Deltaproteobacteria bacterium]|uniref:galactose-1-phosphate uridylyltransferase n=1 Tax=Hydrosulfovibrio ferrireducens TaxID=2934181 RepID=UPI000CBF3A7C|nr:MAG: galactose-1-phosphate uridylyltransferase [Deltaproteobacteria bacterium HGW-Deltaproteobacteria-16]TDB36272.1 MAG: galactose-1-phosphate uridylyltransferase [Deltaproteobacteria bacterium]